MNQAQKLIAKLRRPPAAHNLVKSIKGRRDQTAFALHNFAMFPPRTSLTDATRICAQVVYDELSLEQALKCVERIKKTGGSPESSLDRDRISPRGDTQRLEGHRSFPRYG